ncbi:unnamed protein product, partial [Ixodes persulcatus]
DAEKFSDRRDPDIPDVQPFHQPHQGGGASSSEVLKTPGKQHKRLREAVAKPRPQEREGEGDGGARVEIGRRGLLRRRVQLRRGGPLLRLMQPLLYRHGVSRRLRLQPPGKDRPRTVHVRPRRGAAPLAGHADEPQKRGGTLARARGPNWQRRVEERLTVVRPR